MQVNYSHLPTPKLPTPDKDKDKDKEEDDKDDMTLLINSAKLDIVRVTEVGSLGVGKWGYENDYTELSFIGSLFSSTSFSASLSLSLSGGGWVDMNLMNHNRVEMGLVEYKDPMKDNSV